MGTFGNVRIILAIGTLLTGVSAAFAQQQEARLIDRLLRPDMALTNPAQNKKFNGTQPTQFEKAVRTQSFDQGRSRSPKPWANDRVLTPQQFATHHFRAGDSAANISSRSQLTKSDTVVAAPTVTVGTRVAAESSETTAGREYPDVRPFLGKGKSQKALQAQNRPLTIEQVRELLNKSK